jgi:hypothetical protein
MYEDENEAKVRPVETIPGMVGRKKKSNRGGEFSCDLRTFVNVTV